MHELSIATSLVELAEGAARKAGAPRVEAVRLRLGALAGVVEEALRFSFDIAADGTLLAGARLEIETVPVRLYCPDCDLTSALADPRRCRCPRCGRPSDRLVGGRELELTSIEIPEAP